MATRQNSSEDLCKKLIEILKVRSENEISEVKCDDCRKNDNLVVAVCHSCKFCLCQVCESHHREISHEIVEIDVCMNNCPYHPTKKLSYYCKKCEDFVCIQCMAIRHGDHQCQTVEKMASEHRKMLMDVVAPLDTISDDLQRAKDKISNTKAKVQTQGNQINRKIDKRCAEQLAEVKKSHQQLKEIVQDTILKKKTALTAQLDQIQLAHDRVTELKKSIVKSSNHKILMKRKQETESQVKEVSENYAQLNLQPIESDTMTLYHFYQAIEKPTKTIKINSLGQCWGIAFGEKGVWGVADYSNHCVHLFDSSNQDDLIRSIGTKGSGKGEFNGPVSLAFDNRSCMYVVDNNTTIKCIFKHM